MSAVHDPAAGPHGERPAERLFHLLRAEDADAHLRADAPEWAPPSLAAEGFVHLSFAHQLAGTLEVWFAGVPRAVLLELDPGALGADLRLEPSRDGALFPHLYRALRRADVRRAWVLGAVEGRRDGPRPLPPGLEPPRLGPDAARDDPPGSPVDAVWP